ncbi:GlxA family transcriptional regulator [Paraburkholderia phenazinium]|jgi:transcriptional regulator GlxA family with amidase domain|uniref:Transcriptional regulator GlxA family, contains an amidase domain and an AraC-type DNA-binding HTH domain n=1 Tax=Paraburkholderia phenazinium TaxID=60549 RepID=A0A1G7S1C8_9BURK|nr:helix-turn-helix domain-containing protein [Paraburkholderia phenazinium]SDG16806.1 Transcriptional regulator GlxA family, contains an amidase domain and an AraC-type DNA-binding HTH domain [Paraburkholderia phenazinium]
MKTSVWFVLTPPVLLLDYAGPAEALRMAVDSGAPFDLHHCAPLSRLTTSIGTALDGLAPLPDTLPPNSLVIVVGTHETPEPGASKAFDAVTDWLKTVPAADARIASICSGALLLARAGRLTGRRCTTHFSLLDLLKHEEPTARVQDDCLFVDDGDVLTSAGITAGVDLALYLIEHYAGAELAADIARRQVVYQRRAGEYSQLSPWLAHRNHMHPAVHRAQDAISQDPARAWNVTDLAQAAHVSARHLSRLFAEHAGITILAYQQRLRVARAQQLLERPELTIERVAEQAGFASARDFRRVWRRYCDTPPREAAARTRQTGSRE